MPPQSASQKINLRCYGYRTWQRTWVASCIDLSLMVERPSMEESIKALQEQIILYIQSVLDTDDKESISYLLPRPAPFREKLFYQLIAIACRLKGKSASTISPTEPANRQGIRVCRGSAFNFNEEYLLPQAA